jgi:hypothetical protein
MTYALWIVQVLLALLFLFAGGTKLILPLDVLTSMGSPNQIVLPGLFIRFIGVVEVLGALGLILPRLLRIRPGRSRAGRRHGGCDGAHAGGRWGRAVTLPSGGGTARGVRRLRSPPVACAAADALRNDSKGIEMTQPQH